MVKHIGAFPQNIGLERYIVVYRITFAPSIIVKHIGAFPQNIGLERYVVVYVRLLYKRFNRKAIWGAP